MCHKEYDAGRASHACKRCALMGGCKMTRCPHCGYEQPQDAGLVKLLRRWRRSIRRLRKEEYESVKSAQSVDCTALSEGKVGGEGVIAALLTHERAELHKLMALGVLPGTPIRLLRRFPAFVFQLGYSQFAIDHALATKIRIAWEE